MRDDAPWIATYIMASGRNGTLYIGVTGHLPSRVSKHKLGVFKGFSARYGCKTLVWYQTYWHINEAIQREKSLKRWLRQWKLDLIEADNPTWRDLSTDWSPSPVILGRSAAEIRGPSSASGG